jgi:hypothetical protein
VRDPFAAIAAKDPSALVADRRFHAQNVYALVMNTLARFEKALGRRVSWHFGHTIKVVPHAFSDANAFYSRDDEALLFGYFEGAEGTIYTCLSHDVVVHETTHALLDGLRERFIDPSSPDQGAFHEGFADVVALLSVFSLPRVVEEVLAQKGIGKGSKKNLIDVGATTADALMQSALLGLAEQMGSELSLARGSALRHSVTLPASKKHVRDPEFQAAHRRGEILVAAVMRAFVRVWSSRLDDLRQVSRGQLDLQRVAEEGRDAADYLLTMCIRALDYTPPVHLEFCDFLSAVITADLEVRPDESRYRFRDHLRTAFRDYGIDAARGSVTPSLKGKAVKTSAVQPPEDGAWMPCDSLKLTYDRTHADPLTRDVDEVFRFVWENHKPLELSRDAYTEVLTVRPALRIGPDGFALRETVAQFYQVLRLKAGELEARWKRRRPPGLSKDDVLPIYGGGTLIFDEHGRLKFYVHNSLENKDRQMPRLEHLIARGVLPARGPRERNFSRVHRLRAFDVGDPREEW